VTCSSCQIAFRGTVLSKIVESQCLTSIYILLLLHPRANPYACDNSILALQLYGVAAEAEQQQQQQLQTTESHPHTLSAILCREPRIIVPRDRPLTISPRSRARGPISSSCSTAIAPLFLALSNKPLILPLLALPVYRTES
jgi:hypothetical protein